MGDYHILRYPCALDFLLIGICAVLASDGLVMLWVWALSRDAQPGPKGVTNH